MDTQTTVDTDTTTESEAKTAKNYMVLVHAPIRNCRMPWCKIPGLGNAICTCLKDGTNTRGTSILSKDGKCALTVTEYAEVLTVGVPVLSRKRAYEVSSRLFESAMANDVGTAVVICAFKRAAEEYEHRLADLGLWASVMEVDTG